MKLNKIPFALLLIASVGCQSASSWKMPSLSWRGSKAQDQVAPGTVDDAKHLVAEGKYEQATELLQSILNEDPENQEAIQGLEQIALLTVEPEQVVSLGEEEATDSASADDLAAAVAAMLESEQAANESEAASEPQIETVSLSREIESTENPFDEFTPEEIPEVNTEAVQTAELSQQDFPWANQESEEQGTPEIEAEAVESQDLVERAPADMPESRGDSPLAEEIGSDVWASLEKDEPETTEEGTGIASQISELLASDDQEEVYQGFSLLAENRDQTCWVVSELKSLLDHENTALKIEAATKLLDADLEKKPAILAMANLIGEDAEFSQLAAFYLGEQREEAYVATEILEANLNTVDDLTSVHISEALMKINPENQDAVDRLNELMLSSNSRVRWLSAHALGSVTGELTSQAIEALKRGLRDVDPQVRSASALALGGMGEQARNSVQELAFVAKYDSAEVREAAQIALQCIRK